MKSSFFALIVLSILTWSLAAVAEESYDRLLDTMENDGAYKVRMFAVRVISKRLSKSKKPAPNTVIDALGRAATRDDAYLVRGLAVVTLGRLKDPRTKKYLQQAQNDPEPFVRKQAGRALDNLPKDGGTPKPPPRPGPPPAAGSKKNLVVKAVDVPGVSASSELKSSLLQYLSSGLQSKVGSSYRLNQETGKGFSLSGSIAENSVRAEGAEQRLTIVVKLTIATYPENNLRQVLSAKASAKTKTTATAAIARLQKKLLKAAVDRVVQDSMAQIGGG